MKAILYRRFGSPEVLESGTLPEPALPDDGLLVSVIATSVNVLDTRSRRGLMAPFVNGKFPKVPGSDFAGIVKAVGKSAAGFRVGDAVFGATNPFQGGAFAETVAVKPDAVWAKPGMLSFEEAAALPVTGLAALYSLRELGRLQAGQRVLIYGSTGGAGLIATQFARHFGAHTTTVCGTKGIAISRQMGADEALDYTAGPLQLKGKYDMIVDFSGQFPFAKARPWLTASGRFVESSPTIPKFLGSMLANLFRKQKHLMLQTESHGQDLKFLSGLVESGKIKVTVGKVFDLDAAREAFAFTETGGVIGKVVVRVAPPPAV